MSCLRKTEFVKMRRIIFVLVAAVFVIVGCSNNDELLLVEEPQSQVLTIDLFKHYGEIHNSFLINAYKNFEAPRRNSSLNDAIEYISDFNISFVSKLDIDDVEKLESIRLLQKYKHFVNTSAFYAEHFIVGSKSNSDKALYFEMIDEAANIEAIDDFELQQVVRIGQLLQENHDGMISDEDLYNIIVQIKDQWEAMAYTVESNKGQMLGVILSISISSLEWWRENPEAAMGQNTRIAPWAAADIAGAVIGAAGAAVNGAVNGEVTAGGVATGALIGAVVGSTGVVNKLAEVISTII